MTLHMIKLAVGAESVESMAEWTAGRVAERKKAKLSPVTWHDTRMWPKREAELLAGGSLYWVVKHRILVRQKLAGFEKFDDADGKPMCRILLHPELIRVQPRKKRPFQGWRYLTADDAPLDLDGARGGVSEDLETALKEALAW